MRPISREMAEFALNLEFNDLPPFVVHEAKRFLLDSMGCALAAVDNEGMKAMTRFIEKLGGNQEATVIGRGIRTNAPNATLMNCLLIRALDYNDFYWQQDPCHPSDLIGLALAVGEATKGSGHKALVAMVMAYELEMRWCNAAEPGIREVGWHHATLTQLVSPLVAGKLYDLSLEQMVSAVGISGSTHFTLGSVAAGKLTNMKNMADPWASQAGVYAALMAREGCTGPEEVIEGKEGLIEVLSSIRWNKEELLRGLGKEFLITHCNCKAFPTEALTHQSITGLIELCKKKEIPHDEIDGILVETSTRAADILADPSKYSPENKDTADHSLPYVLAVAAVDGNVLPSSFRADKLHDGRIRELMKKIKVYGSRDLDMLFPKVKRARIKIMRKGGEVYSIEVDAAKGSRENPMTDDEVIGKFRNNAEGVVSSHRVDEIIQATWEFESFKNVGDYVGILIADV